MTATLPTPRRWWPSLLLGLLLFGLGGVAGGGTAFVLIGKRIKDAVERPETVPPRIARMMQRRYDLDDRQRDRLEQVIGRHQKRLTGIRRQLRNQSDPEWASFQDEVSTILGPRHAPAFLRRSGELRSWVAPDLRDR
jgi:hypothetical protein